MIILTQFLRSAKECGKYFCNYRVGFGLLDSVMSLTKDVYVTELGTSALPAANKSLCRSDCQQALQPVLHQYALCRLSVAGASQVTVTISPLASKQARWS